jgi:uncharacterized lipoprotein YddW (UPF0748 family)
MGRGRILPMLSALLVATALLPAAPPAELRGVWMTTTANDALASREQIADSMRRIKEIGLNTVYVEVWKNGYTQFPSEVLRKEIGVDRHPNLRGQRDLLREALEEAKKNGLRCIAWFEYGFMAAHEGTQNELRAKREGWMTRTAAGKLISDQNPFVWMNPMRPECQDLLLGLIREAVRNYPLDGIQLDDRIAWPTSMGYDSYTVEAYRREHHGASPPADPKNPSWVRWRARQVTAFAKRLHDELRALRPGLTISISPAVYPWSLENYACDWPDWQRRGWMDEFVPQVYRPDAAAFERDWKAQLAANPGAGRRLAAGIMLEQGTKPLPWDEIEQKLKVMAETNSGHVFWFSRALLKTHSKRLRAYYAQRPSRPKSTNSACPLSRACLGAACPSVCTCGR